MFTLLYTPVINDFCQALSLFLWITNPTHFDLILDDTKYLQKQMKLTLKFHGQLFMHL